MCSSDPVSAAAARTARATLLSHERRNRGVSVPKRDQDQTSLSDLKTGGMTSRFDFLGFGGKIREPRDAGG